MSGFDMNSSDDYRGIAQIYDLALNPLLDFVRRDICRLLLARKTAHAVDLGCGTGRQCLFLHKHGIRTFGVDRSPAMLRKARARTPDEITYHQEDIKSTSFRDGFFDAAVISLVLHENEPDTQDRIISEAMRIIRPEGCLAILDHGRIENFATRVMHYASCVPERLAGKKHFRNYLLFMKNQGLQGLIGSRPGLKVTGERKYFFGGLWLCLAGVGNRDG